MPSAGPANQAQTSSIPPLTGEVLSSIPIINQLVRGKYYIQIGAFTQAETLESAAARINKIYPMAIQPKSAYNSLVYRLLIGPLNEGESRALLERLKRNGYPDAFIRNGS
jgi:cell division septation protein DedD